MNKLTIDDLNLAGKKVLIRVDYNVPIENGKITSDKRIRASLRTIKKVLEENGKVILFSHLGRIKSEEDKSKRSLAIVAEKLSNLINEPIIFVNKTRGVELEETIGNMNDGEIILVENTRFQDVKNDEVVNLESKNDHDLGKYWASLGDVFINDAFGTAHRSHASNVGIAQNIEISAIGYLVEKELLMLSKGLTDPAKPFIAILGGAKVSDKIGIIDNLLKKADKVIIGGGMAFTFLKSQGYEIGDSLLENNYLSVAKKCLNDCDGKIILPIDFAISKEFKNNSRELTEDKNIPLDYMALDIGEKTIKFFSEQIEGAKTVIWNGPMGVAEFSNFSKGTEAIASAIANQEGVFSIIGGGDSAAAAIKLGFENKFTHISTGGGASLTYLEGKPLPGIAAIKDK